MISLFGQATERLCKKLDTAASDGEDVEMESLFSRLTLDIIGKAVFNYDFDSLTNDTGIVEVWFCHIPLRTHHLMFKFSILFLAYSQFSCFAFKLHISVLYLIRSGCLYCIAGSWRSKCCSNSYLGDPHMERHFTSSKEGCFRPQINQWHAW